MGVMQNFCDALVDCELEDMGCSGEHFTWRQRRLREMLDRVVCNGQYRGLFPHTRVIHAKHTKSDHRPTFVDTDGDIQGNQQCSHRKLQQCSHRKLFEARWLEDSVVQKVIN